MSADRPISCIRKFNNISSKFTEKILYEIWSECRLTLSHFRVWGCLAYVKYLKIDKLGSRSDRCMFVRYPKKIKGYYFYHPKEQRLFVILRVIFLEKEFLVEGMKASKIELGEVQEVDRLTQSVPPI